VTPARLQALPGFQRDIDDLPDMRARKMALDMLVFVRDGRVSGVPLGSHATTGDLGDCCKCYFDPDGTGKPRFRLVYRWLPDALEAVALEAVAVGQRVDLDAYRRAARNLGRT
jgi:mRNA interferase RelE/StbE